MMNGIDVSKHNGTIDWVKAAASGIDFALIRAGYGNDISQKDPMFDENVRGALSRKLHVGAYWFSYAVSVEDAQREAEVCKQVLSPYKGKLDFPVAFDYEYDSIRYANGRGINPGNSLIDGMARAFLDSMKEDGWYVSLYTNADFIKSGRYGADTVKSYDLWLADYRGAPHYSCAIQQTDAAGTVPGISGNVDLDISFKDYPAIVPSGGFNGFSKAQNTVVKIDTTTDISYAHGTYYTVKTTSPRPVAVTAGTGGVAAIVPFPRSGNDQLFALVAVGQAGQETGIYTAAPGEKPLRRFKFKIR